MQQRRRAALPGPVLAAPHAPTGQDARDGDDALDELGVLGGATLLGPSTQPRIAWSPQCCAWLLAPRCMPRGAPCLPVPALLRTGPGTTGSQRTALPGGSSPFPAACHPANPLRSQPAQRQQRSIPAGVPGGSLPGPVLPKRREQRGPAARRRPGPLPPAGLGGHGMPGAGRGRLHRADGSNLREINSRLMRGKLRLPPLPPQLGGR